MPVMLAADTFDTCLDPSEHDVRRILAAASGDGLTCYPVSTRVNSIRKDDPMLIERVPEPIVELPKGKTLSLF